MSEPVSEQSEAVDDDFTQVGVDDRAEDAARAGADLEEPLDSAGDPMSDKSGAPEGRDDDGSPVGEADVEADIERAGGGEE